MNLIEKLKTIYDIAKKTTYQITIHKRRVIDNYNYAKKHQDQFDKLCHKALKKIKQATIKKSHQTRYLYST